MFPFGKGPKSVRAKRPQARMPLTEAVESLQHVLEIVGRCARYEGAPEDFQRTVRRLGMSLGRVSSAADFEAVTMAISELKWPADLLSEQREERPRRAWGSALDGAIPVATALGIDGADAGLRRLREDVDAPDADDLMPDRYAPEMERLAEAVQWLRQTADVLRASVSQLVGCLEPLAEEEPETKKRLEMIRRRLRGAAEIDELEDLRELLVAETTALVEEAQARSEQADDVLERVRMTQTHVQILEYALADAKTMASTDPLTGLGNRRAMQQLAARHARLKDDVGVLVLDLDLFKKVNDTYGHDAGDAVLRFLGDTMLSELRGDDRAFRTGGEEFVALLPGTDLDGARRTAERLRARVCRAPVVYGAASIPVSVSIGVAAWGSGIELKAAINAADKALYEAKSAGRNRVV